jgi:hypothetical protein
MQSYRIAGQLRLAIKDHSPRPAGFCRENHSNAVHYLRGSAGGHSHFAGGQGGEFGEFALQPRRAVQIEPSLRTPSPENGNISKNCRRLSTISPRNRSNMESGDRSLNCKSPAIAGFSTKARGLIFGRPHCLAGAGGFEPRNGETSKWGIGKSGALAYNGSLDRTVA